MIMQAGTTYAITLIAKFNGTLDDNYTVVMTTTFEDAIASGVSFVDKLYKPAGLTSSDYNADYNNLTHNTVYVCQSVSDSTVLLYVPEYVISGIPDPTVRAYNRIILLVDLGVQQNDSKITPLISLFSDQVAAYIGMTNAVTPVTNSANKVYMTDAQYTSYRSALDANTTSLPSLTAQIRTLTAENNDLRDRLAAYEQAVIAAQKG